MGRNRQRGESSRNRSGRRPGNALALTAKQRHTLHVVRPDSSRHQRGPVQLSVIGLNVLYAVIGVILMYLSYRAIDLLTPEVDFRAELQKGNIAVAIFMASIFISIALIIGKALG